MSEKNIDFLLEEFKDDDSYSQEIMKKLKKYEDFYSKRTIASSLYFIFIFVLAVALIECSSLFIPELKLLFLHESTNSIIDIFFKFTSSILAIAMYSLFALITISFFIETEEIFLRLALKNEYVSISNLEIEYLNDFLYTKRKLSKCNIVKYMNDNVYYLKEGEMKLLNKNNPAVMLDDGCVAYETYYEYHIGRDWLVAKTNLYGDRKKDY